MGLTGYRECGNTYNAFLNSIHSRLGGKYRLRSHRPFFLRENVRFPHIFSHDRCLRLLFLLFLVDLLFVLLDRECLSGGTGGHQGSCPSSVRSRAPLVSVWRLCGRMGKEEKQKEKVTESGKDFKRTRRGRRGKGSAFVHQHLKTVHQASRTAGVRREKRQERSTDPSRPVERRLFPALPHDSRMNLVDVAPRVAEYYRKITPGHHPYLKLVEDERTGGKKVVARVNLDADRTGRLLCPVVGYLSQVEPQPGRGIKLGGGEYLDFSDLRYDLGYHEFKGERKHVESFAAEPNYAHYIRCRNEDDSPTNCKLRADPDGKKVVWFVTTCKILAGDEVMCEYDPRFWPVGKEGEKAP